MTGVMTNAILVVALLVVVLTVALQGTVILDLQRKLSHLRRQVLADRAPVWARGDIVGMELPPLDGVSAVRLTPARWSDFLPDLSGLVLVLDPVEQSCWFVAEELASEGARAQLAQMVLVAAAPRDGERFLRRTGLDGDSRVVLTGARNATLRHMGVSWRPAVLVVHRGVVAAAAQFHDAKHLAYLQETTKIGGEAIQPNGSSEAAHRVSTASGGQHGRRT